MSNLREKILSLEPNSNTNNQTALVDGIYITSQAVRRQALSFIWAKYNMLPDNLTQSLGRLYDAVEEIYLPDKNEKNLFNYTHDKSSVYSRSIAEKNLTVKDGNIQRNVTETPRDAYNSWHGKAYQGRDYYNILSGYNESFSENTKITYDDVHTLNSIDNDEYVAIDYENEIAVEYAPLTAATQSSYNELNSYKKPRKKDFRDENGSVNDEKYSEALKKWDDKKTVDGRKKFRKDKKDAKDQYIENLVEQNSFIKEPKTLLTKTSKLFKENKIESLVTRTFDINTNASFIDTSVNKTSGRSRGRNLQKKDEDTLFPFCRSWVAHHQYGIHKDSLIRPFFNGNTHDIKDIEEALYSTRAAGGGNYLKDFSVLKNGFVKITPNENSSQLSFSPKRCMFSIENLAWKDVRIKSELSYDQIGPNGGRIMWFPPYDLQFQESSQVNWNETNFIGRGEPIYTYTNTKRVGTISFTLLIDHPMYINRFTNNSENVEDDDILRFFTGCDIIGKSNTEVEEDEYLSDTDNPDENATAPDEQKKYKFSIYFPPKYSGRYFSEFFTDEDWAEYLMYGYNTSSNYHYESARGYEVGDNGITDESNEMNFMQCGSASFFYRIDKSECGEYTETSSYKDINSKKLNNDKNGNDFSFCDFFTFFNKNDDKIKKYGEKIGVLDKNGEFTNKKLKDFENDIVVNKIKITAYHYNNEKFAIQRIVCAASLIKKIFANVEISYSKINTTQTLTKDDERVDIEIKINEPEIIDDNMATTPSISIENIEVVAKAPIGKSFNESEYFKNLEHIDRYAYEKITEQIKFFHPAYHSISPEGFNSRLTFLHQCTRQGHTLERKNNSGMSTYSTPGNMAFGRPPFCVLRIGDFINTKILIKSLNIVYQNGNGMQWDINQEGIGVQPMFAKVTMQIEIIGGQSLDAPISRLNNAVSFNYYANTGVYDTRADKAIYTSTMNEDGIINGDITYTKIYTPIIN